MIFTAPIEKPSSRHPYSGWDYYRWWAESRRPPKVHRVWHAQARRPPRSRATSRHTIGIRRPDRMVRSGPPTLSESTSGHGPRISLF